MLCQTAMLSSNDAPPAPTHTRTQKVPFSRPLSTPIYPSNRLQQTQPALRDTTRKIDRRVQL